MSKNALAIELALLFGLTFPIRNLSAAEPPLYPSWREGVLLHTGEAGHAATDLRLQGRAGMDLELTRTYRGQTLGAGPLGPGWDHNFRMRLRALPTGTVELYDGRGLQATFEPGPDGGYVSPSGWFVALARTAAGFLLRDPAGDVYVFDRFGRWVLWADGVKSSGSPGNQWVLTYDLQSRLEQVRDDLGHWFRFRYTTEHTDKKGTFFRPSVKSASSVAIRDSDQGRRSGWVSPGKPSFSGSRRWPALLLPGPGQRP